MRITISSTDDYFEVVVPATDKSEADVERIVSAYVDASTADYSVQS